MKGKLTTKHVKSIAIVAVLVVAVGTVVAIKQSKKPIVPPIESPRLNEAALPPAAPADPQSTTPGGAQALPKLVDIGATKCIPCKMMAPILEDLNKTHTDKFVVQFIDVWQDPESGKQYGIRVIPTQIFFAPDGKELFRHEGFYGKEDILAKWSELGF